jgi:UDP-glucose 4-epimerase
MRQFMRNKVAGQTVLVTGGAGFIGSHLVDALLREEAKHVVAMDNLFTGSLDNLAHHNANPKLSIYRDDAEIATSLEAIFDRHSIDIVFNLATKALNYSFVNPANAFVTNVNVVLNLLELQRKQKFKTLCHFSTSEVYGTAVYEPMDEMHPKRPTTTYAAGKAAADVAVESYVNMFDIDAYIVRPFNNYGPRQNWLPPLAGIIPITAHRILKGNAPILQGTGDQSRDFIHVEDTVKAVLALHAVLPKGESVNISTDNQYSMKDVISLICENLQYSGYVERQPARGADVDTHNACNKKIKALIQFQPIPFQLGLKQTLDWYKKHLVI